MHFIFLGFFSSRLITTAAFNFVLQRLRLADAGEGMRAQRASERPPVNRRSDGSRAQRGASGFAASVSGGGGGRLEATFPPSETRGWMLGDGGVFADNDLTDILTVQPAR